MKQKTKKISFIVIFTLLMSFLGYKMAFAGINNVLCTSITQSGQDYICNIAISFDYIRQKAFAGVYPDETNLLSDSGYTGITYNSGLALIINSPDYSHWFNFESPTGDFYILRAEKINGVWVSDMEQDICGTLDIVCYIKRALTWAFIPPQTTFDNFIDLKDDIFNRVPFGYLTKINELLDTIQDNNNPTLSFDTLDDFETLNVNIFDPVRLGLNWLLYFIFAFYLFKRFKTITI